MLLGLRAQPREDTGLSLAEAVFGAPIVLPNEFLQNEEMSVDAIIKIFSKTWHVPAVSMPRHNSSAQLPDELPGDLLTAPLVWVRRGGIIPPLQPLYDGPYTVLRRRPPSGAATRRSRNRFPTSRGGFCMSGTGGAFTGATDAVPVPSMGTAKEVRPLTSSPSSRGQSSGGSPVDTCLHP